MLTFENKDGKTILMYDLDIFEDEEDGVFDIFHRADFFEEGMSDKFIAETESDHFLKTVAGEFLPFTDFAGTRSDAKISAGRFFFSLQNLYNYYILDANKKDSEFNKVKIKTQNGRPLFEASFSIQEQRGNKWYTDIKIRVLDVQLMNRIRLSIVQISDFDHYKIVYSSDSGVKELLIGTNCTYIDEKYAMNWFTEWISALNYIAILEDKYPEN